MRIIQRKDTEAVVLFTEQGSEIRVTVLAANTGRVHLGIKIPPGVAIVKAEDLAPVVRTQAPV